MNAQKTKQDKKKSTICRGTLNYFFRHACTEIETAWNMFKGKRKSCANTSFSFFPNRSTGLGA